jgi:putative ABC transport system permease protein
VTDLRVALRTLFKNPSFAAIALLTLAVGVGGATAIFSVLNAVVLRPLPFGHPDQLVVIRDSFMPRLPSFSVSPGRYLAWQARTHDFSAVAATRNSTGNLTGIGEPQRLRTARVTANLFSLLGVPAMLGRTFTDAEDRPGSSDVIVLSEGLWRSRFGAAPDIVGRAIQIDDRPTTVIGVMPGSFVFPSTTTQAWMPMAFTDQERQLYGSHYLGCLARMRPGVTVEAARADLAAASRQIESSGGNAGWTTLLDPLQDYTVRDVRAGLFVLAGAVGVLLLIACANIANLLLARGVGRQRELGVRVALGATRGRLVRQMAVEHAVLGVAGSLGGLLLGWGLIAAVTASTSTGLPRAETIALDLPTVLCAVVLAGLTPIVFGLMPAVQISRTDPRELMAQGGRSGGSAIRARTRAALIVLEMALAVVLVAGATLLMKSFARLMDVSPGFRTDEQLVVGLSLPEARYKTDEQIGQFWTTLADQASHLPGVEAAGVTQSMPLINDYVTVFEIPGRTPTDEMQMPNTNFYAVSPGYLQAMGIPLLRGRGILPTDTGDTPRVVVISENLAERYFPHENPVGQHIRPHQGPGHEMGEIVGVVGDVKEYGLDTETTMQVYEPMRRHDYFSSMSLVVRTPAAPAAVTASVRRLVNELDAELPVPTATTLQSIVDRSVGSERLTTTLLGGFAGVALLLAAIGVYGIVSFMVGQRVQEIGVRMALGARPGDVLRLVFRQGLLLAVVGALAGVVAWLWASRLITAALFQVSAHDPVGFLVAPVVLVVAAALACYWPARRALGVNPITVLRQA